MTAHSRHWLEKEDQDIQQFCKSGEAEVSLGSRGSWKDKSGEDLLRARDEINGEIEILLVMAESKT
jgi:hypothetical protein